MRVVVRLPVGQVKGIVGRFGLGFALGFGGRGVWVWVVLGRMKVVGRAG